MQYFIGCDEWYPVYLPAGDEGVSGFIVPTRLKAEMTEEEYADFIDAYERFNKWQDILQDRAQPI